MAVDLFGWRELKAAEVAVATAHAELAAAKRKAAWAPHGLKRERQAALQAARCATLRAEVALVALQAEAGL